MCTLSAIPFTRFIRLKFTYSLQVHSLKNAFCLTSNLSYFLESCCHKLPLWHVCITFLYWSLGCSIFWFHLSNLILFKGRDINTDVLHVFIKKIDYITKKMRHITHIFLFIFARKMGWRNIVVKHFYYFSKLHYLVVEGLLFFSVILLLSFILSWIKTIL